MYRLILVPLDGSPFAEFALPLALGLSRRTGAAIRLVSVRELLPAMAPVGLQDAVADWGQDYLEDVADGIRKLAGGEVTTSFRSGSVSDGLLAEAEAADLTVMATHGRGSLSRAWLGSVADNFVRHVDRPVLLTRPEPEETADLDAEWTISRILLPLDGTPVSEAIVQHATELGSLFGASYHLVRVVPLSREFSSSYPPHMIRMNREYEAQAEEAAKVYLDTHAKALRGQGLKVSFSVVMGAQPVHGILVEAESSECDFIAISAHSRRVVTRAFLGSTADKVLRGAHQPVLMYRHRE